jgi:hypothetical protein
MWRRARAGTDIKWLRNSTATALVSFLVSLVTKRTVDTRTVLLTWLLQAAALTVWETGALLRRRFVVAPCIHHEEQAAQLRRVTNELDATRRTAEDRHRRKDLAAKLSHQSQRAHELRSSPKSDRDEDVQPWLDAIAAWHAETLQVMRDGGCSQPEIHSVETLGNLAEFNPRGVRFSGSGQINTALLRLDGYRQRLAPIIQKYDA